MKSNALIKRRKTRQIMVGDVAVGGDAPISVQSMTNTEKTDIEANSEHIGRLVTAGVDIVRVSVPTMDAAEAFNLLPHPLSVSYTHLPLPTSDLV